MLLGPCGFSGELNDEVWIHGSLSDESVGWFNKWRSVSLTDVLDNGRQSVSILLKIERELTQ